MSDEVDGGLEQAGLSTVQIDARFPAITTLDAHWVHILNDMTPMIGAMSDNVAGYQEISSLPPFPLFPWFFVLPGVIVAGLALAAGSVRRPESADPLPVETTYEVPVPEYQGVS